MKLTNIVLAVVAVSVLAVPAAQAQKLKQLAQAVGGVSIKEMQTRAMFRTELKTTYRPHFDREAVCCIRKELPTGTRHVASAEQLFRRARQSPRLRAAISVEPFGGIELAAVKIPENSYISQELIFLPANSYALLLPDGEYRFSTPAQPFNNAVQSSLQRAFLAQGDVDVAMQEAGEKWPGKDVYVDTKELARDVVKYFKPLRYYAKTAHGPVYLYDVPEGVTYVTSQGHNVVLHSNGTYAILKQARTGELKFINKKVWHFDDNE